MSKASTVHKMMLKYFTLINCRLERSLLKKTFSKIFKSNSALYKLESGCQPIVQNAVKSQYATHRSFLVLYCLCVLSKHFLYLSKPTAVIFHPIRQKQKIKSSIQNQFKIEHDICLQFECLGTCNACAFNCITICLVFLLLLERESCLL